jgi:hypothetical protein
MPLLPFPFLRPSLRLILFTTAVVVSSSVSYPRSLAASAAAAPLPPGCWHPEPHVLDTCAPYVRYALDTSAFRSVEDVVALDKDVG